MKNSLLPPVIVIAVGSYGDLFPYLRLAQAFQARGHAVQFVASSYHRALVEQAGLPFIGLGNDEDYLRILRNPDLWDARKGFALLASFYPDLMREILATLSPHLQTSNWLISHPLALPAAAILREQGRIARIATAFLAPSNIPSCYGRMQLEDRVIPAWLGPYWRRWLWRLVEKRYIDQVALPKINQVRQQLNLAPIQSYFTHMLRTPDAALCLFPAWFGAVQKDWPAHLLQADFPLFDASGASQLNHELAEFLAAGPAPLVFTPGTGHQHAQKFFQLAAELVQRRNWRAIFLTKDPSQLPANLPASILWQAYAPLSELLPKVALLAHHGGIGTSAEAMRAGVPQLVTPYAWDQFDNAGRMQELAVARSIAAKKLTLSKLESVIVCLLQDEQVKHASQRLASHFAQSMPVATMCEQLVQALGN